MPARTEHRFPPGLTVPAAAGRRVTPAGRPGPARAAAASVPRTGTCPARIHHARTRARPDLPAHHAQPAVAAPGPPAPAARSGAPPPAGSPPRPPAAPGRTGPRDRTGPCSPSTAASCPPARPAPRDTGRRPPRPPAAPAAHRRRPRPAGRNAPAILPPRTAKG